MHKIKYKVSEEDNIYNLKLNEALILDDGDYQFSTQVLRVPGGWIYTNFDKSHSLASSVFVPYNKEED